MNKYAKKRIVIEAIQFTGGNVKEIKDFCTDAEFSYPSINKKVLEIKTLEGKLVASENDFIIKGVKGEFYPCKPDVFEASYDKVEDSAEFHEFAHKQMAKSLHNTTSNGARKNVKDIQFWGDGDTFKLISKASSENEGWMKSTKAMEIEGVGCVVQTTTQQRNPDGSYSLTDAVTFVPGVKIQVIKNDQEEIVEIIGRKLVKI